MLRTASGGAPGGANGQLQYNSNGQFAGASGLTYDSGTGNVNVSGSVTAAKFSLGNSSSGFSSDGGFKWIYSYAGSAKWAGRFEGLAITSESVAGWTNALGDATATIDAAISRGGVGVLNVGTGAQGDASGTINAAVHQSGGTQVVAARRTGYGTPTGNAQQGNWAAGAITLANLAAQVAQIQLDLRTHGLIGT